jgi:predicted ribonuclease YlaK
MSDDQGQYFHLLSLASSLTSLTVLQGTWAKLSEVAVKGAQYNSRERQPHPKCLERTRVDLLKYIHQLLDEENNQLIWLHGVAGVGKSAVAFTVAEKI